MLKFRCNHCGHRLATPRRHLGKLVVCPECGRSTHPLAQQIDSARDELKATPTLKAAAAPTRLTAILCRNCGRAMGRLEPQRQWAGHVVCAACHGMLAGGPIAAEPAAVAARPSATTPTVPAASAPTVYADVQVAPLANSGRLPSRTSRTGELRVVPIQWRHRPLILLAGLCIAGSAAYGALSLLRDLAGILAFVALVLLAGALALVLLRVLLTTGRRPAREARFVEARTSDPDA